MTLPFQLKRQPAPGPFEKFRALVEDEFESDLVFYMNGQKVILHNPNPEWTLLDFVRSRQGFAGTKLGCGEGGCGACTVVLQSVNPKDPKRLKHLAVNACLFPLVGGARHGDDSREDILLTVSSSCWQALDHSRRFRKRR